MGLCYSVVNMHLNGGLGGVIKKNSLLYSATFDKITGVKDANNTDLWIVSIQVSTDTFFAYHLTSAGLDTIPVKSECGRADSSGDGYLKFSPSGTKVALAIQCYYGFDLLKFNDTTGQVYRASVDFPYSSSSSCSVPEGMEFSPDESKLYWTYETRPGRELWQANLKAGSNSAIASSVLLIDSNLSGGGGIAISA